jgi:hypothetical protein
VNDLKFTEEEIATVKTYPLRGTVRDLRIAEQNMINQMGGKDELLNARNEIAEIFWIDFGVQRFGF